MFKISLFLILIVTFCFPNSLFAETRKLKVGTAGSPPFVFNNQPTPVGISIEIWNEIATAENLDYQLIPQSSVKTGLDALIRGEIDILIGPISITEDRLKIVQFTQPYYSAEIGLLLPEAETSVWNLVQPFFQIAFISSIAILILLLFVVGNLLWLAEKRRNREQFPQQYFPGITTGMWLAMVTLSTVGYGDKVPITKTGRIIITVWMLISMVAASSLTAGLASALTIALSEQTTVKFKTSADLANRKIAVVEGTTSAEWGKYYKTKLLMTDNLQQAIETLVRGEAEGVIFDTPALRYYLTEHPELNFALAEFSLARENYGFAVPIDNKIVHDLNIEIVRMDKHGEIQQIVEKWLN